MTKPRKPREFWIIKEKGYSTWISENPIFSDVADEIHVREVLPETPDQDAEAAAREWAVKRFWGYSECDRDQGTATEAHLAGQSIGEARRTREICEWLRTDTGLDLFGLQLAIEIEKRFGGK